jgi:hypothetical protein
LLSLTIKKPKGARRKVRELPYDKALRTASS